MKLLEVGIRMKLYPMMKLRRSMTIYCICFSFFIKKAKTSTLRGKDKSNVDLKK